MTVLDGSLAGDLLRSDEATGDLLLSDDDGPAVLAGDLLRNDAEAAGDLLLTEDGGGFRTEATVRAGDLLRTALTGACLEAIKRSLAAAAADLVTDGERFGG